MTEFNTHSTKQLTVGNVYRVTFAGTRYRATCIASSYNERRERNASGSLIPLAGYFNTFRAIEAI